MVTDLLRSERTEKLRVSGRLQVLFPFYIAQKVAMEALELSAGAGWTSTTTCESPCVPALGSLQVSTSLSEDPS